MATILLRTGKDSNPQPPGLEPGNLPIDLPERLKSPQVLVPSTLVAGQRRVRRPPKSELRIKARVTNA